MTKTEDKVLSPMSVVRDALKVDKYGARKVGEHWGQVIEEATGEVAYDGLDMSEVVQIADTLNGNENVSRNYYNG